MEEKEVFVNLHYIPIIIFISLPTTFLISCITAAQLDHVVVAGFPYISDTGTSPPESCIFGQLLNIIAALMGFLAYLRYCQIKEYIALFSLSGSLAKWNFWGLIFGLISSLGMSLVGNFQETSVMSVHLLGATACFGGATIYFWTQSMCSYYLHPLACTQRLVYFRMVISALCTIFFILGVVTASLSQRAYKGTNPRKWTKEDGGFEWHVVSSVAEWISSIVMCVYILSFTNEFRECQLYSPKIIVMSGRPKCAKQVQSEIQDTEGNYQASPIIT